MFKYIIIFSINLLLLTTADASIERRAAFDFGSGKMKVQVADVDTETNHIVKSYMSESEVLRLSEDLARQPDGKFSAEAMDEAIKAAGKLKEKALKHGATEFRGIATEAYRKALNANELVSRYINELDIFVTIVSQDDEGVFGFRSLIEEKKLDRTKTICWDIGGGSFQITFLDEQQKITIYKGPFGRSSMKNAIIEHVKHQNPQSIHSPNPINQSEWQASISYLKGVLLPVPESLLKKLAEPGVQLVGIAAHPEKLRSKGKYHKFDIEKLMRKRLGKTDKELEKEHDSPAIAVTELVLISGVLELLQANEVTYFRTNSGSTSGLLTSEEYWPSKFMCGVN